MPFLDQGTVTYTTASGIHATIKMRLTAGDQEKITNSLLKTSVTMSKKNGPVATQEVISSIRAAIFRVMVKRCWDDKGTVSTDPERAMDRLAMADFEEIVQFIEDRNADDYVEPYVEPQAGPPSRSVTQAIADRWSALEL